MTKELANLYSGKKIVITGCTGYIAGALISSLKYADVAILGISRSEKLPAADIRYLQGSLSEYSIWEKIIDFADIIFHLAGNTSVYTAANDPEQSFVSSVLPVMHLIRAAKTKGKKVRVVYASTATLYGLPETFPVNEHTIPEPVTVYDLHKMFAENELKFANSQQLLDSVSLRLANVYGPSTATSASDDRGIVNRLTKQALQGVDIKVYGHGNYLRDYVYIDDVVNCFLLGGVVNGICGKSFVVASGSSITVYEAFKIIAEEVARISGSEVAVSKINWPENADPIEKRNFVVDTRNFEIAFGWRPQTPFREGVKEMVRIFSNLENKKKRAQA
ncbi:MAG: NAD-dependent epimerase/dehydratase family protein [Sediminibacterium sp.]